jgi:NHLM bacteriocin system ABC transporter ATP-binding protein
MLSPDSESYGEGLALLAVPYPGTRVIKFPLPKLRALCRSPQHNEEAAGLINDWVASLTDSITGNMASPRGITLLEPGQNVTLKPRDRATSRKGGIWLRMQDGMGLYLGEEEITFPSDEGLFPLFGNSWLSALEETRLAVVTGREAVADPRLWEGLELFHEIFFRMCFTGIRLVTFDEINRLRQKAEYDQQSGQEALYNLSSILPGKTEKFEAELKGGKNVLLAACRLVGESLGIAVQAPADRQGLTAESNMLVEIGRVSRFRTREVTLEPGWWTRDNGPLLGFWKEGIEGKEAGSPVAILPVNARSYRVIDPADNSQYSANKTLAAMLEPTGFVFYRPFPLKTLRALDLIRFGVRGARKDLLSILLLSIAAGLIALFVPAVTAYLFDTVTPSGNQSLVWQVLAGLIVAAISATTFQLTRSIAILRLETRLDNSIQAAIWDRLLELPISFFRKFTVGDLAVRAMGVDAILHLIGSNVIVSILSSIFSVFSFFLLFVYDVRLALVALGLTLFTLAVIIGFSVWELRYQRSLSELQGRVSGQVLQLITGISKLRVAGAETRAFRLWSREFANQRRVAYKARTVNNYQTVFNSVWPLANSILIFFFIDLFHKDQGLTTGVFLAFIAAFGQFLAAMIAMAGAFTAVLQAIPLYERVRVILDEEPEIKAGKIDPGDLSGSIELNHVSFRYSQDTPYILNDVSVSIKPGQFVAIVGPSGSGKSTLLRLILGFETPESGTIYYDNQDLGELDVSAVRRRIGVVMQNGKLMPGDILSNIIGSSLYSVEDAWEAARMAGLEDDIKSFPMGMYTIISEGASTLSGGQRQRLMIARSIIGKPRILLFDEATSALDNQTQAIVSRSLENLQSTRIVIAHRLSTIEKADCIYVLQGGKVAQSGTYEELMSQEGPFKELASRQLV